MERVEQDEASTMFQRGLDAYEAGDAFEAHEHWETLWRQETAPDRRRYLQALVQIAAAVHKHRTDPAAAARILARAAAKLASLDPGGWELDLDALRGAVDTAQRALTADGSGDLRVALRQARKSTSTVAPL